MERIKDWLADLWQRVWPWRIVSRAELADLVSQNQDLRQQNWDMADEIATLKKKPAPRTRRRKTNEPQA